MYDIIKKETHWINIKIHIKNSTLKFYPYYSLIKGNKLLYVEN